MNMKRMRGRNHRPNSGGSGSGSGFRNQQNGIPLNRNHVFDSSGPEMRVRGTAQQLYEKYQQLARDAFSNGDRVTGEAYYQHAEHYFRIISAINQAQGTPNPAPNQQNGQPYQANGQDRGNYQGNGQERGNYNNDRDYNRRDQNNGDVSTEPQPESRSEQRPQQESRPQEQRYQEPRRYEPRQNDQRNNDNRQNEPRNNEPRNNDQRPNEQRNGEQRANEPRNNDYAARKPEFPRQDRQDRYRPAPAAPAAEARIVDARIDISSALEAELAATIAEPAQMNLAGFGEQPVIQARTESPAPTPRPTEPRAAEPRAIEPRSIPIIPDAPPAMAAEPAVETTAEPVKTPRPRGRPRTVKPEVAGK
jgi:hypothetical protein